MNKYHYGYDLEKIDDEKKKASILEDRTDIPKILAILEEWGEVLDIPENLISPWYASIVFLVRKNHLILEFQYCARRFQVIGARAETYSDFRKIYFNKSFLFKEFSDWLILSKLKPYLEKMESIF